MFVKKTGSFCCSACGSHPVAAMRGKADGKWRAFVDAVGGVPRVDRRCLLLGAKLMAVAVGGSPDAVAGVSTSLGFNELAAAKNSSQSHLR